MSRYPILLAAIILLLLGACTVSLNVAPGSVVVYVQPQSGVWSTTIPDITPTQESLPTETPMPTPRPLTMLQNVTPNRYHIRQCPAPNCTHLGWIEPGGLIEADLFASTDGWVQVFRDDVGVGWVSGVAFGEYHG